MVGYRRSAAQFHEHPARFFGAEYPPARSSNFFILERPPAIKSAKQEKVPSYGG
jgi:hypothetical protein